MADFIDSRTRYAMVEAEDSARRARNKSNALEGQLQKIGEVLAEFGCTGPCGYGICIEVKECDDYGCPLDIDNWCLACRIQAIIQAP